jgi:hypothetical protein
MEVVTAIIQLNLFSDVFYMAVNEVIIICIGDIITPDMFSN